MASGRVQTVRIRDNLRVFMTSKVGLQGTTSERLARHREVLRLPWRERMAYLSM